MNAQRLLYASTVVLSSALLFLVQPIVARNILPAFGGSAAVWTTSALFFQSMLLAGYLYAHLTTRMLAPSRQAILHTSLLILSVLMLQFGPGHTMSPRASRPVLHILGFLELSVGLPYFLLSATGPLVQSWFARTNSGRVPYRLYAVSNAASLGALISYPFMFERYMRLEPQFIMWIGIYIAFVALCIASVWLAVKGDTRTDEWESQTANHWRTWLVLSLCPAVLWLAVANHLSQSVAAVPLLWILPLALYLLSFIVAFDGDRWYRPGVFRWLLPAAWLGMASGIAAEAYVLNLKLIIIMLATSMFVICTFCHGELARRRPSVSGLTGFYLWIALGGVSGSVFVAIIAPLIFRQYFELPLAVVLSIVLGIALVYGSLSRKTLIRVGVTCTAALTYAIWFSPDQSDVRIEARNFYGVLRVVQEGSVETACRSLFNGRILHGVQWIAPSRSRWTTTYYAPESGIGRLLANPPLAALKVGVIGLGVGTLAAYGRPGDEYRFYEINPLVTRVAESDFRFLSECRGSWAVVEGDGRLVLQRENDRKFDVLVLDAFSGDSIPVHLLTREAFGLYFARLSPSGVLAFHVTNKYLDLAPVVAANAESTHRAAVQVSSGGDPSRRVSAADWVIVAAESSPAVANGRRIRPRPALQPWTDDFNNVFQVLK